MLKSYVCPDVLFVRPTEVAVAADEVAVGRDDEAVKASMKVGMPVRSPAKPPEVDTAVAVAAPLLSDTDVTMSTPSTGLDVLAHPMLVGPSSPVVVPAAGELL